MAIFQSFKQYIDRKLLKNQTFSLISNDCWAGEVYHYFNLAYNTPFIGLYIMAPCYIRLLQNFKYYMELPLEFVEKSRYKSVNESKVHHGYFPTAVIHDVEIQFLHYKSEAEAIKKWERRKDRINWDNLFFKFDGNKDEATDQLIHEFDNLDFQNKICFVAKQMPSVNSALFCPNWDSNGVKLFYLAKRQFPLVRWLNRK